MKKNTRPFSVHKCCAASNRRAFTLVEVITSLVIISFLSTAVGTLVFGTMNSNRFFQAQVSAESELDAAQRRIVYNLRTAGAAPTWSTVSSKLTLSIAKTGVGTILYYVDSNNNLVESDPRYNTGSTPNTLVHGIATNGFVCTVTSPSSTQVYTSVAVNITLATARPIERHMTIVVRGF
jgi:prepilin-type N-terminal cleavage/methylation domain-containing protein